MDTVNYDLVIGCVGWKDTKLRHLGCNQNLANELNLKSPAEIIGIRDKDLLTRQDCLFHYENDKLALMGYEINKLHYYRDSLFLITKKPLYGHDNKITGLIYHCQELNHPDLRTKSSVISIAKKSQEKVKPNPYLLSKRELDCLDYLLQGYTAKAIANTLRLSKRTIDHYIDNIKNKMGCTNKSELLISAIKYGYD